MLALTVFLGMFLLLAVLLPVTARAVRYSTDFNQAQSITLKKLAQLQEAGFANMTGPSLGQSGLQVVDGTPSTPATNDRGDETASFEFSTTDRLWTFFPGGANADGTQNTVGARRPRGYVFLEPYNPSAITGSSPTTYSLIRATVVVQWWGWGSQSRMRTYTATTLISKTTIQ